MTITLQAVNELIASLESAGELSIREQKFLKLAKAFKHLATENVALKNAFGPGDSVLNFLTIALRHTTYDRIDLDDVTLAFKMSLPETPATARIVAEAEARGVEKAIAYLEKKFSNIGVQIMNLQWLADSLREGADK